MLKSAPPGIFYGNMRSPDQYKWTAIGMVKINGYAGSRIDPVFICSATPGGLHDRRLVQETSPCASVQKDGVWRG